ncbi:HEPN domain-containing protein [Mycobacterium intracellulare]|uniref:HEPN domain-containing protein n=1 Tax=Mycobacterium intracellulare TaxID=1767 RepID=UPI001CD9979D|nr:HEPN domain-containing protein [Mycobacterium intracellulare]MCA2247569.1 HEPN domain-containing protein [Mycobacterium intracellulare]
MTTWNTGRAEIAALLQRKHLERISGAAADGTYLLRQARQRLAGAHAARTADHIGAYELAYDATRHAVTALLLQQGLRPTTAGGHAGIAEAIDAQFGTAFRAFNRMRRIRNQLEYPRNTADLDLPAEDTDQALSDAEDTISAAEKLLDQLGIWQ